MAKLIPQTLPQEAYKLEVIRSLLVGLSDAFTIYQDFQWMDESGQVQRIDLVIVAPYGIFTVEIHQSSRSIQDGLNQIRKSAEALELALRHKLDQLASLRCLLVLVDHEGMAGHSELVSASELIDIIAKTDSVHEQYIPGLDTTYRTPPVDPQIYEVLRRLSFWSNQQPGQGILLELMAAYAVQQKQKVNLAEALDILERRLGLAELAARQLDVEQLSRIYTNLKIQLEQAPVDVRAAMALLNQSAKAQKVQKNRPLAFDTPQWLVEFIYQLSRANQPLLFMDFGAADVLPLWIDRQAQAGLAPAEFSALERSQSGLNTALLLLAAVYQELAELPQMVQSYDVQDELAFAAVSRSQPELWERPRFGLILVNLLLPEYRNQLDKKDQVDYLVELAESRLVENGRMMLLGPLNLLAGSAWETLRSTLWAKLHLEAVVDFSSADEALGDFQPAIVLLRKPQQTFTRLTTVFAPAASIHVDLGKLLSGKGAQPSPLPMLQELLSVVLQNQPLAEGSFLFERPTAQIHERWDARYYSPARQQLQDALIAEPSVSWLSALSYVIQRGLPRTAFKPYTTAHVAGVISEGEHIVPVQAGEKVWLHFDQTRLSVNRRSGRLIGYLDDELVVEFAPLFERGLKRYAAEITQTDPQKPGSFIIRYAPPEDSDFLEPVKVIRLLDISSNRLTGPGEAALIQKPYLVQKHCLQAGDVLLQYTSNGIKACLVSSDWEGAVPSQELILIRPRQEIIDPYYLVSYLLGSEANAQFGFIAYGEQSRIDIKDLEEILVPLPPLEEQRRLALAFALARGDLDITVRPINRARLLPILDRPADYRRLIHSLFSDLTSDLDQVHTLDDWLRLKSAALSDLRNVVEQGTDYQLATMLGALGQIDQAIRQSRQPDVVQGEERLSTPVEFQKLLETVWTRHPDPFVSAQFGQVLGKLSQLTEADIPKPEQVTASLSLYPQAFPTGREVQLSCTLSVNSAWPIEAFYLGVYLDGREFDSPQGLSFPPGEHEATFSMIVGPLAVGIHELTFDTWVDFPDGPSPGPIIPSVAIEALSADQLAFAPIQPNPYITGGPVETPEMFFGRQDVLDFLKDNLIGKYQSNVIILQGNRRTGKSSILKQIVNQDLFAPHIPVYIECQGLGKLTDQKFFYKLARELARNLARHNPVKELPPLNPGDISADDPFYDFRDLLERLMACIPGRRAVLLFDEFEVIDQAIQQNQLSPLVLENLRYLFQHRQDLAIILTGSYRLGRLTGEYWSPLFGLGLKRQIGFLDQASACRLITEPLAGQANFKPEAIERILQLTACQPYFIQVVCHNLVNQLNQHQSNRITLDIVEEAAQETLISADGHFKTMYESISSTAHKALLVYLASSLGQAQQALPIYEFEKFIDASRLPVARHELEEALREMAERDLVTLLGETGRRQVGFKIDLLRQFIHRNYDLQSALNLAQATPYIRE